MKKAFIDFLSKNGKYLPMMILAGGLWHCGVICCEKLQPEDTAKLANSAANLMDHIALLLERVEKTQIEDHQETVEKQEPDDPSLINIKNFVFC